MTGGRGGTNGGAGGEGPDGPRRGREGVASRGSDRAQPVRIAVLVAPMGSVDDVAYAALLADAIQCAADAGRPVEVVLGLDEAAMRPATRRRSALGVCRRARWSTTLDGRIAVSDGANDFLDCNLWILVGAPPGLALRADRPLLVVVRDCALRYHPECLDVDAWRQIDAHGCALWRQAARILVPSARVGDDVRAFGGIPRARLGELPLLCVDEGRPPTTERDHCIVWNPGPGALGRLEAQWSELLPVLAEEGEPGLVVCADAEAAATLPLSCRARVRVVEGVAAQLEQVRRARALIVSHTHAAPGSLVFAAIFAAVHVIAPRSHTIADLEHRLGVQVQGYAPTERGGLARALREVLRRAPSQPCAVPLEKAVRTRFTPEARGPAFVDALLSGPGAFSGEVIPVYR